MISFAPPMTSKQSALKKYSARENEETGFAKKSAAVSSAQELHKKRARNLEGARF